MEAWLSKHQSMQTSKKGCRAWPQLRRQLQEPLGSCARTLLLKASLISLSLCRTQGLASAADKVEDNLGITKRAPILLMHGAIQGGWVWEFPRISQGAARVRAKLQCHELISLPPPCQRLRLGRTKQGTILVVHCLERAVVELSTGVGGASVRH